MKEKLSKAYTYRVPDLFQNKTKTYVIEAEDGPTEMEARKRALAYVKRLIPMKEFIGDLTVKVTHYFKPNKFVNRLIHPSPSAGGTATVYKSRAEFESVVMTKNGKGAARQVPGKMDLVSHRPDARKAGMDGESAIATVTSFVGTVKDVKDSLVHLVKRQFDKIRCLGIWPEDVAKQFRPDLFDLATIDKRITIGHTDFEPGSPAHISLFKHIQKIAPAHTQSAINMFGRYDLHADRRLGKRGALVKDADKARILATLKSLGIPDLCMLQPFIGGTGRPNTYREELLMACFMLVAVFDRLRVLYENLNVSNSADLEELLKRSGAPRVFNDTWAMLLPMSRRDPFLTEEIMKKLCPDARTMYLSLIEARSVMVGDLEELSTYHDVDEDGEPVDDLLMPEPRSDSETSDDGGDPRFLKDDLSLADVREITDSVGRMPDRMRADLFHVLTGPNMRHGMKSFAKVYSLTTEQHKKLVAAISSKRVNGAICCSEANKLTIL
jgi:hypothetical protein